jgi:repressor LexA
MKGLTQRQVEILSYIESFVQQHRFSPSYREIALQFGISSISSIHKHIQALLKKGVLQKDHYSARSILPKVEEKQTSSDTEVPFIGYLSQTDGIELFPKTQTVLIPKFLVQDLSRTYVVRVKGDGFSDELFQNGDLLIIDARSYADSGETILCMLPEQKGVIKKYFPTDFAIELKNLNLQGAAIVVPEQDLVIVGVIAGLLRLF